MTDPAPADPTLPAAGAGPDRPHGYLGNTDAYLARLRRIEGQVRGLQRMVEEDRYCADILTQLSSVHEALRSVERELMRNHLRHCASSAIKKGPAEAEAMYDELVELIYRHQR